MARIVAVEDDPDVHHLLKILLEDAGHEVAMAGDGAQALELLAGAVPDLLIADVALPGQIDGVEVLERVRADPAMQDLPVLLLTARARAQDVQRGQDAGASDYLLKPFDVDELLSRVAALLG